MSLQAILGMASTLLMGVVAAVGVYYTYNYYQEQQQQQHRHRGHGGPEYRSNEDFYASDNSSRSGTRRDGNWPGYDSQSNVACSICLEDVKEGRRSQKLKCGHLFHTQCILPWLRDNDICPNCKAKVM